MIENQTKIYKKILFYGFGRVCCLLTIVVSVLSANVTTLSAQEVSVSPELNIRNYYSYEILGKITDRYLVYRDKGFIKEVDVFNEYMEHSQHSELIFEKKKTDMISTVGMDTSFQMIYGFLEKDSLYIKMRRYDKVVQLIDSSTITTIPKKSIKRRINSKVSEDKSKVLIYTLNVDDHLDIYLYDNRRNRLAARRLLKFTPDINIKSELRDMLITDSGDILMMLYKQDLSSSKKNQKVRVLQYSINTDISYVSTIDFGDMQRKDVYLDYDNINQNIIISGLYSEKKQRENKGIFLVNKKLAEMQDIEEAKLIPFSESLVDEVTRSKKKKNKVFEHFTVKDIVKRQDGGIIMILELSKEFSRRSSYATNYSRSNYNPSVRRGWVDYYNEDIIISSIKPDGEVEWSKILYKKQFSQDDEAIYSSFHIMLTPSRMRLLYNDEIKSSNTVSEYIMDPVGNVARNSLLSTDDQGMKLRFRDAIQLNNRELLVPSENNFNLNLVRISY